MKNVLLFRKEWHEALVMLSLNHKTPASYEALAAAILRYAFRGVKPDAFGGSVELGDDAMVVLDLIFAQIDRDRREN